MLFELIATIAAGFAAAGLTLVLNRLFAGRLPRWSVPVAAGAAMLAVTIANEYSWYPRTQASLPPGFAVTATMESQKPYRPWSYLYPFVSRFLAVDTDAIQRNDALPGYHLVSVYAFERWHAPQRQSLMVDCEGARHALMSDPSALSDASALADLAWATALPDDRITATVCAP